MTPGTPTLAWYKLAHASEPIEQGDLINDFPLLVPSMSSADEATKKLTGYLDTANVIVMTQSCDFQDMSDDDPVIICARFDLSVAELNGKKLDNSDYWGKLRRGYVIAAHLLNKCDISGHEFEYQIIDLRRIFSVPFAYIKEVVQKHDTRISLLPPYREHLSQAFARQFMRIGLPIDLPDKYPK